MISRQTVNAPAARCMAKAIASNEYARNAAGFPPLTKGGQGGFWRQRSAIPWQNPPRPPFAKEVAALAAGDFVHFHTRRAIRRGPPYPVERRRRLFNPMSLPPRPVSPPPPGRPPPSYPAPDKAAPPPAEWVRSTPAPAEAPRQNRPGQSPFLPV